MTIACCKTCRFMRTAMDYKYVIQAAYMGVKGVEPHRQEFCHLQPSPTRVDEGHWCGQHKPLDTATSPAVDSAPLIEPTRLESASQVKEARQP